MVPWSAALLVARLLLDVRDAEPAEAVAETDAVRVEFLGASGGMKLFNVNAEGNFLMVQQDEMLEVNAAGEMVVPPNRMNMAGGNNGWDDLVEETTGGLTSYRTRFQKTDGGKAFSLAAHVARSTISTFEEVPCSGCLGDTAGVCIDVDTSTCSDKTVGPPSTCPLNSRGCVEPIELTQDTLKFSITVTAWDFVSPGNRLRYSIAVKGQNNAQPVVVPDENSVMNIDLPGTGWLEIPTTGMIVGGAAPVPVDVGITTRTQGSQFIIDFDLPHFEEGTSMYYDPTLGMGARSGVGGGWGWLIGGFGAAFVLVAGAGGYRYRSINPKMSYQGNTMKNRWADLTSRSPTGSIDPLVSRTRGYTEVSWNIHKSGDPPYATVDSTDIEPVGDRDVV